MLDYGDFGTVLPKPPVRVAPSFLARFTELLFFMFKEKKSEAGPGTEFLGITISFRGDSTGAIVSSSLSPGGAPKTNVAGDGNERAGGYFWTSPSRTSG